MYDLSYVKKRRRRKIAALVSLFTAIGITSLVIISFLGRTVGTFSIKLTNTDVKLSLCEKSDFKNPTSYLHVGKIPTLREFSYTNLPDADYLDNENTDVIPPESIATTNDKGDAESVYFAKYTFYIRNTGNSVAQYNISINISDSQGVKDETSRRTRYVDETLRIMVYESDPNVEGSREHRVFARESNHGFNYYKNKDGVIDQTLREFVSFVPEDKVEDKENGYELAESFISDSVAAKYQKGDFAKGDVKRYTLVIWLEGEDPNSENSTQPPEGASLKLGVDIAAYENA